MFRFLLVDMVGLGSNLLRNSIIMFPSKKIHVLSVFETRTSKLKKKYVFFAPKRNFLWTIWQEFMNINLSIFDINWYLILVIGTYMSLTPIANIHFLSSHRHFSCISGPGSFLELFLSYSSFLSMLPFQKMNPDELRIPNPEPTRIWRYS